MAYTRPSASAADASWLSASAYTRPAVTAADASFVVIGARVASTVGLVTQFGTPKAGMVQAASGSSTTSLGTPELNLNSTRMVTGFTQTSFGSAIAVYDQFLDASGFRETAFGGPTSRRIQPATGELNTQFGIGLGRNVQRPTGFTTTQFGAPFLRPRPVGFRDTNFGQARLFPYHVGAGFGPAKFGAPIGTQHWDAGAWTPVTRFGTPTTPTNRTTQAAGSVFARLGQPTAIKYAPPNLARTGRAAGFKAPTFGTPSAGWTQTVQAAGIAAVHFGTPRGVMIQGASGFSSTALGMPLAKIAQKAAGFKPTQFGAPSARRIQMAAGLYRPVRFGLPTTLRSDTYLTYGFTCAGRFGQPRGFSRFNYAVTTGSPATRLGSPACHQRHRIASLPTVTRFGTPLLKRITQC